MKVGSLFSGVGGIELGFKREGFKTSWFVEKDAYCQAVLKKHWPYTPIYGDITTIDFKQLEPVEILTGGFPCQDISIAGKRKGITAERSGLWKEYARAISEIRPRYAVVENVANLVNFGLNKVLCDLAQIGYDAEWTTLCASDFGALHKRERIFIIATDSECSRRGAENKQESPNSTKITRRVINAQGNIIANDWSERVQRFRKESLQGVDGFSWCKDVRRIEDFANRPDIPQPLVRRGDHGVSNRLDRTKAIGNAVVPQVAQFIAQQIKQKEAKKELMKK